MQLGKFARFSKKGANDVVGQYIHANGKIGVLVYLSCGKAESAAKPEVQELAKNLAMLVEECDLLMVVGARLGDRATGRLDSFCPKTGIVHIDIDACEVGKLRIPQVGITADAAQALKALLPLLRNTNHDPWLKRVDACKAEHGLHFDRMMARLIAGRFTNGRNHGRGLLAEHLSGVARRVPFISFLAISGDNSTAVVGEPSPAGATDTVFTRAIPMSGRAPLTVRLMLSSDFWAQRLAAVFSATDARVALYTVSGRALLPFDNMPRLMVAIWRSISVITLTPVWLR